MVPETIPEIVLELPPIQVAGAMYAQALCVYFRRSF